MPDYVISRELLESIKAINETNIHNMRCDVFYSLACDVVKFRHAAGLQTTPPRPSNKINLKKKICRHDMVMMISNVLRDLPLM